MATYLVPSDLILAGAPTCLSKCQTPCYLRAQQVPCMLSEHVLTTWTLEILEVHFLEERLQKASPDAPHHASMMLGNCLKSLNITSKYLHMGQRNPRTRAGGQTIITLKARFGFLSGELGSWPSRKFLNDRNIKTLIENSWFQGTSRRFF